MVDKEKDKSHKSNVESKLHKIGYFSHLKHILHGDFLVKSCCMKKWPGHHPGCPRWY